MAGGILDIGNESGCRIIRADGSQLRRALDEIVKPGDIIDVPEAAKSKLFKNMGAIQSLTSLASLILAWMAIDRTTPPDRWLISLSTNERLRFDPTVS
jgi:hypothetical protein